MKAIKVFKKSFNKDQIVAFKKRNALLEDVSIHIDHEALIHLHGNPVVIYKKMPEDLLPLLAACEALDFNSYERTGGMKTYTVNIGNIPRNPRRDNVCKPSELKVSRPVIHDIFEEYGRLIGAHYQHYFKKAYKEQIDEIENGERSVFPEYLIEGTPFTGGVINKDNVLPYHTDSANTPHGISCMIIKKASVVGGELVLPELDLSFACQDNYMLLFDGQKFLHGVTPIYKQPGGYRYTIVYYNNKGMALCLPHAEEIKHYEAHVSKQILKKENHG